MQDVAYLWVAIGLLAIFSSISVYYALRGRSGDDMIRTGVASWSKVSYVRAGCVVGLVAGIGFIVAGVLFYYFG